LTLITKRVDQKKLKQSVSSSSNLLKEIMLRYHIDIIHSIQMHLLQDQSSSH